MILEEYNINNMGIMPFIKNRSSYSIRILIYIIGFAIGLILILKLKFSSSDAFLGALAGGFIGFIGSLLLKDFSLYIEERIKKQTQKENTKFIYNMYKMEIQQNISHLKDLIDKKWIPYYRLKSITRDSFWGQLADYSRDIELFQKINVIYQEIELINNKIDIMNALRTEKLIAVDDISKTRALQKEIQEQLDGCLGLGSNVLKLAEESIVILDKKIIEA